MKILQLLTIAVLVLASFSCSKDAKTISSSDLRQVYLETLRINEQSRKYLEFYTNQDTLIFVKVDENILDEAKDPLYEPEYWKLIKTETLLDYIRESHSSDFRDELCINMKSESPRFIYSDGKNSFFTIGISFHASPDMEKEEWKIFGEDFFISHDKPRCDYIDHQIITYRPDPCFPDDTNSVVETLQVGTQVFTEVMKAIGVSRNRNMTIYATKENGIIRIDTKDLGETWILATTVPSLATRP